MIRYGEQKQKCEDKMKIDFFEEFPTKENLEKLKLIKFPSKIFIAAESLEEFKKAEKTARKFNKKMALRHILN